jgi:hypothetical protein
VLPRKENGVIGLNSLLVDMQVITYLSFQKAQPQQNITYNPSACEEREQTKNKKQEGKELILPLSYTNP